MKTKKEVFADNIGQISFVGGMVRFDYVSVQPDTEENAVAQRVVMPVAGFLNAYEAMQQLIGKLLEAGVLKQNPVEEKPAKKAAKTTKKSSAKTPRKSKKAADQTDSLL